MYGPSGTITKHDSMCILALNIINEKIFVFLWFFFVILAIITAISMLYRILVISSLEVRVRVIKKSLHDRVHDNMIRDVLTCPNHSWIDQVINEKSIDGSIVKKSFSDRGLLGLLLVV